MDKHPSGWHLEVERRTLIAPFSSSLFVVLLTARNRMVLAPDETLTIYPRENAADPHASSRPSQPPRTVRLDWCTDAQVGQTWRYAEVGTAQPVWVGVIEEIYEIGGDLAEFGPRDIIDRDSTTNTHRREVNELWLGDLIEPTVTVWIRTHGDWPGNWDGMWMLTGDDTTTSIPPARFREGSLDVPAGISELGGQVFAPSDPEVPLRTWTGLRTNAWARVDSTLWLEQRLARGVWTVLDSDGCGTIASITIEQRAPFT